jgi:LuxR family maltose regulon positive regulatory protein
LDLDHGRADLGGETRRAPSPVPPLPPFHVARPRLLDILNSGTDRPLTAVVAPPGAGKSVTLAAWVRERCPNAAWVGCDELDRDPVVFWGHVGAALRAAQGDRWLDVVDLLGAPEPDLVVVVDTVLRWLADEPAVLVLDDVHVARDAGPLMSRLVERLPAGSRVVTGSRGDPPFALHRLRADGRCLEVREAELRLSPDEVDGLVNALGVSLSAEALRVLADRTDGWVAGVQMAAIALRSEPDPDAFLAEFSGSVRIVSDFLVEEVLAHQSEVVQRFLLRTSVLDELDPGACAAVTGHDDAATFLRRLETSGMFIVPTGPETYRYHQLFRDMLRYRLRATSLEGALDAHRRAGEWYESREMVAAALPHLLGAGDVDRAYELLQAKLAPVFMRGGAIAVRALVTAMAGGDPTPDAGRMVTVGSGLVIAGALTSGGAWLERALRQSGDLDDEGRRRLTVARGHLAAEWGDARGALELLESVDPQVSDDGTVIAAPFFEIHTRGWLHDFSGAREAAARTRTLPSLGAVYDEVMVGGALSWAVCVEGSLHEAEGLAEKALATGTELGLHDHPALIEPLRTRGRLCFECGDLRGAEAALERSVMLAERCRPPLALISAATLARVWVSEGRLDDATEAAATARAFLPPDVEGPLSTLLDGLDARIALLHGDSGRAEAITQALPASFNRSRLEARRQLAERAPDAALRVLEQCVPETPREKVDMLMLRARCEVDLVSSNANASLVAAVGAARLHGFTFAIAEELSPLAPRLGALLRSAPLDDFAVEVLELLERVVPLAESASKTTLVDPLTNRELVVLRYLESRLTTSEIASELFVSVNTVRTHTKACYRKLGVGSRRDAVAEAHRLGIR